MVWFLSEPSCSATGELKHISDLHVKPRTSVFDAYTIELSSKRRGVVECILKRIATTPEAAE
jgi:hypothetical protein